MKLPWLYVLMIVAVLAFNGVWLSLQWNECKAMGFSTLYCIKHTF